MIRKSDNIELPDFIITAKNQNEIILVGRGIECQVYLIVKDKLVCKVFSSHAEAEYSYRLQRIAHRAGIAPEPMGIEFNYFFSRFAASIADIKKSDISCNILPKNFNKYANKKYKELLEKVDKIFGNYWKDETSGNVGAVKIQGKTVFLIIDFGVAGFRNSVLGGQLSVKLNVYHK